MIQILLGGINNNPRNFLRKFVITVFVKSFILENDFYDGVITQTKMN